jgi:hypothetical protein
MYKASPGNINTLALKKYGHYFEYDIRIPTFYPRIENHLITTSKYDKIQLLDYTRLQLHLFEEHHTHHRDGFSHRTIRVAPSLKRDCKATIITENDKLLPLLELKPDAMKFSYTSIDKLLYAPAMLYTNKGHYFIPPTFALLLDHNDSYHWAKIFLKINCLQEEPKYIVSMPSDSELVRLF